MKYFGKNTWVYLDGEFVKADNTRIDVFGQSLHYGYAAIEGIRAYNTHNGIRLFKGEQHYERLRLSCDRVGIPFPWETDLLIEKTYQLLEKNNLRSAYVRPMVLTGHNMYLTPSEDSSIVILAWEWGPFLGTDLIHVTCSPYQRPNPHAIPPDAKIAGQYVASILATTEATKRGYDEAILMDSEGHVAQASSNNLFIEKDGRLYTPALGHVFPGITRQTVLEIAKALNVDVIEKQISPEELKNADSAFLTGTATGIVGIAAIDGTHFPEEWADTVGATIQRAYKNLTLEKENYEVII
ncbi:branched-chain amino acid aminotransferase [Parapedobacter composti]|uniref:Branched-chain-amino-acid aminotransferase n=1 Tax=Parapedobacter composti TaxID=623281 RepID=A0A1I1E067_9SPHI|nr:branched-chain-amino-acid transaminase [Parapedobacter composti]SFB80467.1 branched-chain amino acid aminotransferase [Parapedobacter composti]